MNVIFFGAKRAFQATLRISRPLLAKMGLTPARFDLLTAIWRHPCGAWQRDLHRMLGVTAATVSRMLRSLQDLGLIRRERSPVDRRLMRVTLSGPGLARIRRATRRFIDTGAVQLALDCALVGAERCADEWACMMEMGHAEWLLRRIRAAFGDIATLYYPWHPDD